jgi:Thioesterase domain
VCLATLLSNATSLSAVFLEISYVQNVLGYSPWETGLRFMPMMLTLFVVAGATGSLLNKVAPGVLIGLSIAFIAAGIALVTLVEPGSSWTALLADDELWQLFCPVFRGDFELVDTWQPEPAAAPIPVPLTAFGGNSDPMAQPETLALWSGHTERFLGAQIYTGAHFYLNGHRQAISRQIVLSTLLAHTDKR